MKEILRLVGVLTIICLICTALLAFVNGKTEEPIKQATLRKAAKAAKEVMPEGLDTPERLELVTGSGTHTQVVFVARKDGAVQGVALEGRSASGYSGEIVIMVGISDGKLVNFKVTRQTETPGLGNKIAREDFNKPLRGRDLVTTKWQVKKDGGDVDAVTAATISSRAACEAIRDALDRYAECRDQLK